MFVADFIGHVSYQIVLILFNFSLKGGSDFTFFENLDVNGFFIARYWNYLYFSCRNLLDHPLFKNKVIIIDELPKDES